MFMFERVCKGNLKAFWGTGCGQRLMIVIPGRELTGVSWQGLSFEF